MHPLGRRIADVLELQPDATAIEYDGRWSTWREVTALVEHIRALEVGQRQVGILLRNKPAHVAAFLGVLLFTVLMISREGMETALLLMQLRETLDLAIGAAAGALGAAGFALLWSRYGHRVNLSLFFQVTAIFLFVFVIQLVVRGVHEMSEQAMLPYSAYLHDMTESWGPDSTFGHLLTYLLVLLPLAWLTLKSAFFTRPITVPRMPERVDSTVPQGSPAR